MILCCPCPFRWMSGSRCWPGPLLRVLNICLYRIKGACQIALALVGCAQRTRSKHTDTPSSPYRPELSACIIVLYLNPVWISFISNLWRTDFLYSCLHCIFARYQNSQVSWILIQEILTIVVQCPTNFSQDFEENKINWCTSCSKTQDVARHTW